ncbi:penicillin acylase family protein [Aquihabitans daechungensis]|uniref:penicillin acylase family protein n=1 Tax=Aquihabitans daechungensis TaxID=1052257 RepID=UPI003B9EC562
MTLLEHLVRLTLGRRLPVTSGTFEVRGTTGPIRIERDHYGVPTITGGDRRDATFGLGFATAQDRSFQLEFARRASSGTLSALLGRQALGVDRLVRRIGFWRAAERQWHATPEAYQRLLAAYADGINEGMAQGLPRKAHEFTLLRSRPGRWSPIDVLAFVKVMASALSTNWDTELARLIVATGDGLEALMDCDPGCAPDHVVTNPPGTSIGPSLARAADELRQITSLLPMVGASNNWVVSGDRTAEGRPLVASDPHLNPTSPSYWYLARLRTPDFECSGAGLAGAPGMIIGQNGAIAWSVTAGRADESDLFIEEVDASGSRVRRGDGWSEVTKRQERIEVRWGRDVVEEVTETDRGPIITPLDAGQPWRLSLAATWLGEAPLRGFFDLPSATSTEEVRASFDGWIGPPVNLCYGAVDGTIGWTFAASVPARTQWALLPRPAADPADGWDERRSGADLPWCEDPANGYLATANNQPVTPGRPHLGDDWVDGYRVGRIGDCLAARTDWTLGGLQRIQLDTYLQAWDDLVPHLEDLAPTHPDAVRARSMLLEWDGDMGSDIPAAALAETWIHHLAVRLYRIRAPRTWETLVGGPVHELSAFTGLYSRRLSFVVRVLGRRPAAFDPPEGWPAMMEAVLVEAIGDVRRVGGVEPRGWRLGTLRPLVFQHPLAKVPGVSRLFDIRPRPVGGSLNTVAMSASDPRHPWGRSIATATLRAVMDVGMPTRSRFALPGGQSGNPFSPHFRDQLSCWEHGVGIPIGRTEERFDTALTLVPGDIGLDRPPVVGVGWGA